MQAAEWLAGVAGVRPEEPLGRHSQFGVGGPAEWFLRARDVAMLAELLPRCSDAGVNVTVLGAGSNALILDGGIRGLVVHMEDRRLTVINDETVELAAGCMLPRAALDCARQGLAGIEFGIGVPGSLGASVYGNAGAFGTEIKDVLRECTVLTPKGGELILTNSECGFGYRHSRLKDELRGCVVISARLAVSRDEPAAVRARTDAVQAQRKATQPYGIRSLGSVFKNPPGDAAGHLIESCGLKGLRSGGAEISTKHANFIVNVDSATADDVLDLVERAHDEVKRRFGIDLEREIIVLGDRRLPVQDPARS